MNTSPKRKQIKIKIKIIKIKVGAMNILTKTKQRNKKKMKSNNNQTQTINVTYWSEGGGETFFLGGALGGKGSSNISTFSKFDELCWDRLSFNFLRLYKSKAVAIRQTSVPQMR